VLTLTVPGLKPQQISKLTATFIVVAIIAPIITTTPRTALCAGMFLNLLN
jgi:hypothetical protein